MLAAAAEEEESQGDESVGSVLYNSSRLSIGIIIFDA